MPAKQKAVPTFQEGDLVEQYQHFDGHEFVPGPDADKAGTLWRVARITARHIVLRLEEGKYLWGLGDEPFKLPGFESRFTNSDAYKAKFRGCPPNQQLFAEFRPVRRSD